MAQLRQDYPEFSSRNTEIIAVGPEDIAAFAAWWRENNMPFVGLADPDHRIANLYGQEVNLVKLGRMPAQFIIDRQGRIRFRHHSNAMWDIPPNQQMLELLERINQEST
jgi:peroxiredoxin Q/BCP